LRLAGGPGPHEAHPAAPARQAGGARRRPSAARLRRLELHDRERDRRRRRAPPLAALRAKRHREITRETAMDFNLSPAVEDYRKRIRAFVDQHVIPLEVVPKSYDEHENINEETLRPLRAKARAAGLWCFQMPKVLGGQGVGVVGMAACYEEMARSIFGPLVFNCAPPDDGNMIILEKVGSAAQKERWLQPIIDGKVRSSFVMTEPHPGAGSDPLGMMRTRAERRGNKWVVHGHKWFITGADGAEHFILIARTSDDPRKGLSAFLFHKDQPGWKLVRRIGIMGPEEHGGHCELVFDGLEIPEENVLMGIGDGMK